MTNYQKIENALYISGDIFLRNFITHAFIFGIYAFVVLLLAIFFPWVAIHLVTPELLIKTYMVGLLINMWALVIMFFTHYTNLRNKLYEHSNKING